jgi:hypothetical protein
MQVLFQLSYSPTERGVYQRVTLEPAARAIVAAVGRKMPGSADPG